jgi:hypothetical protein
MKMRIVPRVRRREVHSGRRRSTFSHALGRSSIATVQATSERQIIMNEQRRTVGVLRRTFLQAAVSAGLPAVAIAQTPLPSPPPVQPFDAHGPLTIERAATGSPGRVVHQESRGSVGTDGRARRRGPHGLAVHEHGWTPCSTPGIQAPIRHVISVCLTRVGAADTMPAWCLVSGGRRVPALAGPC